MFFNFPTIKTTRTSEEQAGKVIDETWEYRNAKTQEHRDEEAIDLLHAVETFIRIHFKGREKELNTLIKQVTEKNKIRGYYDVSCF